MFFRNAAPSGPRGKRAYAVGDVHGRLDLLDQLLGCIEAEISVSPRRKSNVVFLGDLVDRGPESAQVIERLRTYSMPGANLHFIMGNHEEVMLRILSGDGDVLPNWLRFGGAETLRSYGADPRTFARMTPSEAVEAVREAVPPEHVTFLSSFADSISFGNYLFVHAGIRPGIDLSEQSQADLRWIREPFLGDTGDHGFVVVHGHTITTEVEVRANRIAIDTGAYSSGTLTALAIEGTNRWLLQTSDAQTERVSLAP